MTKHFSSEQDIAADPKKNIWVQANAGTGKTSVLVQRLLRILFRQNREPRTLSSRDLIAGPRSIALGNTNHASGILCLTYTNAGATEMRNRILGALRDWATKPEDELRESLRGISEKAEPDSADCDRARKIFYEYIDNQDILKIKTLHSFCEEILRRFPIEAGIPPAWNLVQDSDRSRLLKEAFQSLLDSAGDTQVADAFGRLVDRVSEYSVNDILQLLSEQYRNVFQNNGDDYIKKFFVAIDKYLDIDPYTQTSYTGDIPFDEYKEQFLTKEGEKRKRIKPELLEEQDRVYQIDQHNANITLREDTRAIAVLSHAFANKYRHLKLSRGLLDFDDIILYAGKLFSDPESMGWVLSQLDRNLRHILVDEAQDTSPEQWAIVRAIANNFFSVGDMENPRSLFVVGDSKQSIYSFQGADPQEFFSTKNEISRQISNDMRKLDEVPLDRSFRTVRAILGAVDHFFADASVRELSGFESQNHKVFRDSDGGIFELHKTMHVAEEQTAPQARREYIRGIADKI